MPASVRIALRPWATTERADRHEACHLASPAGPGARAVAPRVAFRSLARTRGELHRKRAALPTRPPRAPVPVLLAPLDDARAALLAAIGPEYGPAREG